MMASWSIGFLVTDCLATNVAERSAKPVVGEVSPDSTEQHNGAGSVGLTEPRTILVQVKDQHVSLVIPEVDPVGCSQARDGVSSGWGRLGGHHQGASLP
jgi:hypothetical protein